MELNLSIRGTLMLDGIHFLLTYTCNWECDHCFVFSGPKAKGTFKLSQIRNVLDEAGKIDTMKWVFFEGGEPTMFYPLMVEGLKLAKDKGFKTGVVTNAYWATCEEDAELWLRPLAELGLSDLSISKDTFHWEDERNEPAGFALAAAKRLGIHCGPICIEKPTVREGIDKEQEKGKTVIGGGAMFRGRAVEKLVKGLQTRNWKEFTKCPYENLKEPKRVHLDSYGNVHICQGLSMGNMWETPLSVLDREYDAGSHPLCGPLGEGGPAGLAKRYKLRHDAEYVDACHLCYSLRRSLIDKFPQYIGPRQVYGME